MGIKYAVNESFFNRWTPRMAYVLGYLYADGSLEDAACLRGKYVRVTSIDRESIERLRKWMSSQHTIIERLPPVGTKGSLRYLLRIGSHRLYDDLVRIGLYPKKSLTITLPSIPRARLRHFVRGYLDGDGCLHLETTTGSKGQRILKRLRTIFTSGSKKFLEGLEDVLRNELGLSQRTIYTASRSFQLRYSTKDSVKLCRFLYQRMPRESFLKRKYDIYKRYLALKKGAVAKG